MGLREQAEADLGMIVENTSEWGWPITLTDPDGKTEQLVGLSNDISLAVDPDTGMLVSGRTATVALRISTLRTKGFAENPKNIPDSNRRPWVVGFKDINQVPNLFKVIKSNPDRAIGVITLILETYRQAVLINGQWVFDGAQDYNEVAALL